MSPNSSQPVTSVPDGASACERVRDAFLAGSVPTDPELLVHAKTCEECSLLLAGDGELGQVLAKASAVAVPKWPSVGNAVRNERGLRAWVRSRPTRQRLLMVLVAALTALLLGGHRPRQDQPDGAALGAWVLVLLAATLVCAALALGSLGRLRSTGRRTVAIAVGVLLPVAYALTQPTSGAAAAGEPLWPGILSCFGYGTVLVLPLFALIWLLDRDDEPAPLGSVITGVAAGLAANAALSLHCAEEDAAHLLLGHAAIGAWLGLVGAAFAAFLARRRDRA
jgi:hypothetical protein